MFYLSQPFSNQTTFHKIAASTLKGLDYIPVISSMAQIARLSLKLIADLFELVVCGIKRVVLVISKPASSFKIAQHPITKFHQNLHFAFKSVYLDELYKKSYKKLLIDSIPILGNMLTYSSQASDSLCEMKQSIEKLIEHKNHSKPLCYTQSYIVPEYLKYEKSTHLKMAILNPWTVEFFDEVLFKEKDFVQNLFYEFSLHYQQKSGGMSEEDLQKLIKIVFKKSKDVHFLQPLAPLIESDFKGGNRKELLEMAALYPVIAFALASKPHFQNFTFLNRVKQFYPHILLILPMSFLKLHKSYVQEIILGAPQLFDQMPKDFQKAFGDFRQKLKKSSY